MRLHPALAWAAAGVAWIVGCALLVKRDPSIVKPPSEPHPIPPIDPPASPVGVRRWAQLTLPEVELRGGELYRAEVDLPPFVGALVSQKAIEERAPGFDSIRYWDEAPADWPGGPSDDADLFVEGRYVEKYRDRRTLPDRIVRAYAYRLT